MRLSNTLKGVIASIFLRCILKKKGVLNITVNRNYNDTFLSYVHHEHQKTRSDIYRI